MVIYRASLLTSSRATALQNWNTLIHRGCCSLLKDGLKIEFRKIRHLYIFLKEVMASAAVIALKLCIFSMFLCGCQSFARWLLTGHIKRAPPSKHWNFLLCMYVCFDHYEEANITNDVLKVTAVDAHISADSLLFFSCEDCIRLWHYFTVESLGL